MAAEELRGLRSLFLARRPAPRVLTLRALSSKKANYEAFISGSDLSRFFHARFVEF